MQSGHENFKVLSCSLPSKHKNSTANAMGKHVYWGRRGKQLPKWLGSDLKLILFLWSASVGVRCWHTVPIPLGLFFWGGSGRSDLWFWGIFDPIARKVKLCTGKTSSKSVWKNNRGLRLWDNMFSVSLRRMETKWKEDVVCRNITHRVERNWYLRKVAKDDHKGVTDWF